MCYRTKLPRTPHSTMSAIGGTAVTQRPRQNGRNLTLAPRLDFFGKRVAATTRSKGPEYDWNRDVEPQLSPWRSQ